MRVVMHLPCECSMRTHTRCCCIHTASPGTGWIHFCVGMNPLYMRILHSLEFVTLLLNRHWHLHSNLCFTLALKTPRNICSIHLSRGQCGRIDRAIRSDSVSTKKKEKKLRCWLVGFWILSIVLVVCILQTELKSYSIFLVCQHCEFHKSQDVAKHYF